MAVGIKQIQIVKSNNIYQTDFETSGHLQDIVASNLIPIPTTATLQASALPAQLSQRKLVIIIRLTSQITTLSFSHAPHTTDYLSTHGISDIPQPGEAEGPGGRPSTPAAAADARLSRALQTGAARGAGSGGRRLRQQRRPAVTRGNRLLAV